MKNLYIKLCLLALSAFFVQSLHAYDFAVSGIYYKIISSTDKTVEVTYKNTSYNSYSGSIIIPATTVYKPIYSSSGTTYKVISIGNDAFRGCSELTSVTIPSSVKSIGSDAFYGCTGLTAPVFNSSIFAYLPRNFSGEYSIPEGIKQIVGSAFSGCTGLTSITIPSSVTSIGDDAFSGCTGLTAPVFNSSIFAYLPQNFSGEYSISEGIKQIARSAFYGCSGLTSVTIPSSVTSIGDLAFYGCSGLTSATIPSSVTSIGSYAFSGCSGLTSISIPSSVTSIGSYAFRGCTGLTSITIPSSVTSIGSDAFSGCSGLTSISIPSSVTSIGSSAFHNCRGLTSISIPSSVTSIGSDAFSGCSGLTSISIPSSVTSIGSYAFVGCSGLTSVTIPSSVTSIGEYAFYGCSELTSISIPSSVTSIGDAAFYGCTGVTNIKVDANNDVYDSRDNCNAIIKTSTNKLISGCQNTTIPSSVTSIGSYAFSGCSGLTSISIPSSVTSIGSNAFYGCTGLTSITIPSRVTTIGSDAFDGCTGLTSISIPSGVTSIGSNAFYGCTGLTSVTISGESVSIGNYYTFPNPTKIYVKNHSKTLQNLWLKKYSNIYDIETGAYIGRPYLECTKKTLTSLTFKIVDYNSNNTYKVSTSDEKNTYYYPKDDGTFTVTGLTPGNSYRFYLYVDDSQTRQDDQVVSTSNIKRSLRATNVTASSFNLNGTFQLGDAELISTSITVNGKTYNGNTITITGLKPNSSYESIYTIKTTEYTFTTSTTVTTPALTLITAQPKVISAGNVLVSAETNIDPAETNVGFEWRRTDWTDDFASNTGKGYVNGESMEGKIKNLYTEKLWKYRPYYQSSDGTFYYGDWVGIDPTNTSWFEPTVHTYADFSVDGNTVLLKGYTLSGTDNVTEQGFKYWKNSDAAAKGNSAVVTVDAASVPADAQTVAASGELMSAELTGLDYNSVYYYAAYVKTSTGETFYGEQRSFTIGENPTGIISVKEAEEQEKSAGTRPIMAGWFTLDGRKLQTAPTRSGIYIHNGRKVSVK